MTTKIYDVTKEARRGLATFDICAQRAIAKSRELKKPVRLVFNEVSMIFRRSSTIENALAYNSLAPIRAFSGMKALDDQVIPRGMIHLQLGVRYAEMPEDYLERALKTAQKTGKLVSIEYEKSILVVSKNDTLEDLEAALDRLERKSDKRRGEVFDNYARFMHMQHYPQLDNQESSQRSQSSKRRLKPG